MLRRLTEAIRGEAGNSLVQIKQSQITGISDPGDSRRMKAEKYFLKLKNLGFFDEISLSNTAVVQQISRSSRCFLGIESRLQGSNLGFLALTSTENSLNRAFAGACGDESRGFCSAVDTISGMCLFGSGVDLAVTGKGKIISLVDAGASENSMRDIVDLGDEIVEINVEPRFSLYEMEKLSRLVFFLNHLSGPAKGGRSILITPRVQYYLYLIPLYEAGRISGDVMEDWFNAVDCRDRLIRDTFASLSRRPPHFPVSSLDQEGAHIRDAVQARESPCLFEILRKLRCRDPYWEALIDCESPSTWKALINLSYTVQFMIQADEVTEGPLIHVDDQIERVILSETARLKKHLARSGRRVNPLVGIYLLQWLVDLELGRDSDLYRRPSSLLEYHLAAEYLSMVTGWSFAESRDEIAKR